MIAKRAKALVAVEQAQMWVPQQAAAPPPRWNSGGQAQAQGLRRDLSGSSLHSLANSILSGQVPDSPSQTCDALAPARVG